MEPVGQSVVFLNFTLGGGRCFCPHASMKTGSTNFYLKYPPVRFVSGCCVSLCSVFIVLSEISNAHFSLISELIHSVSLFVKAKASVKTINVFCSDL